MRTPKHIHDILAIARMRSIDDPRWSPEIVARCLWYEREVTQEELSSLENELGLFGNYTFIEVEVVDEVREWLEKRPAGHRREENQQIIQ